MKTTIDIAQGIFLEAKKVSKDHKKTFRELVEEGLRLVIQNYKMRQKGAIKIAPHVVSGNDTGQHDANMSWSDIQGILQQEEEERFKK